MWYFTWILGVLFAMGAGVINVLWLEAEYFCKIDIEEAARGRRG